MGIVIKQGIQNTILSYTGAVLGFVNKLYFLPKILHVEQVGLINIIASIALLYAQFSGFGVYQIILKFYPYYSTQKKGDFLTLILFWITIGFGLVTVAFLFFDVFVQENFLQNSPLLLQYYYWIIPLAAFIFLTEVLDSYSKAILKSVFSSFVKDIFLRFIFLIGIALYWFKWIDFDVFVKFTVFSYLITLLLLLGYFIKLKAFTFTVPKIPKKEILNISRFGFYALLTGASTLIITNIDSFMLSYYTGLSDVGIYTTMSFMVSAILIPYRSIFKIASPLIPIHWKNNNHNEIQKIYLSFSLITFFISATLFLLVLNNTSIVFLFLDKIYSDGFYIFILLGFARLIEVLYSLNSIILMSSSKYWVDLVFLILLIILTIISNMIFIPKYAMGGAVFASALSIIIINLIRGWFVYWFFKIKLFNTKIIAQFSCFVIAFSLSYFIDLSNIWLNLIVKNLVIAVVFVLPVFYFSLAPDMNDWILKKFKK
jgi:O-antigen/teichoic acid export membrane protein